MRSRSRSFSSRTEGERSGPATVRQLGDLADRQLGGLAGRQLGDVAGPARRLRTLRLEVAYDGSAYAGWQVQPDRPTVQGELLAAAGRVLGEPLGLVGASRTDAGVHAVGQTASLRAATRLEPDRIRAALNAVLPPDVRVTRATEAAPGFDARRDALGKRYVFVVDTGAVAHPLWRRFAWHLPRHLDLPAMRLAACALVGRHDFSAFCAAPGRGQPPLCRVTGLHLVPRRTRLWIAIAADRFLHHMVRNLVGSLVMVGRGIEPPAWLGDVLGSRDRRRAGPTAPAHGLTLLRVRYPR